MSRTWQATEVQRVTRGLPPALKVEVDLFRLFGCLLMSTGLLVFDRNTTEHDGTRRNMTEHDGTWRNMTEHDATWRNMKEHDGTWRNMTEHDGTLYMHSIYIFSPCRTAQAQEFLRPIASHCTDIYMTILPSGIKWKHMKSWLQCRSIASHTS